MTLTAPTPEQQAAITKWLNTMVTVEIDWVEQTIPIHRHMCHLYAANGGFKVSGWGVHSSYGPRNHPLGITQKEAFEIHYISGILAGMHMAGIDFKPIFTSYMTAYIEEWQLGEYFTADLRPTSPSRLNASP